MTDKIPNYKGERMLQRAGKLDFFWAYRNEELPRDEQLLLLDNVCYAAFSGHEHCYLIH